MVSLVDNDALYTPDVEEVILITEAVDLVYQQFVELMSFPRALIIFIRWLPIEETLQCSPGTCSSSSSSFKGVYQQKADLYACR